MRCASTVVGSTLDALKAYPYKNAMKFREENVQMNYTTFMVCVSYLGRLSDRL